MLWGRNVFCPPNFLGEQIFVLNLLSLRRRGGGGFMFSGRPSVPLSVRPSVRASVRASVRPSVRDSNCVRPSVIHVVVLCFRDISSIC